MNWQDTLRRLDADLAAGRISAAEHIKRRDQVLAEAASGRPPQTDPDSTLVIRVAPPRPPQWLDRQRPPSLDGAAVFATARRPRGKGSAVAVLAVLALVAGGVWWFAAGTGDTGSAATPPTTTAAQVAQPTIPDLPGAKGAHGPVLGVEDAVRLKLLATDEADVLTGHGVTNVLFANSTAARTSYAVVVARTPSPEQADRVAEGLIAHLERAGYTETPDRHLAKTSPQSTVLRVVYRSGDSVVRVGAAQAGSEAPTTGLGGVLATVREAFPES